MTFVLLSWKKVAQNLKGQRQGTIKMVPWLGISIVVSLKLACNIERVYFTL